MRHMLLIDDEKNIRLIVEIVFKSSSEWRCSTAESGYLGLELAAKDKPDVILCDVHMPSINGPDTIELASQRELGDVPFIWLTGRVDRPFLDHLQSLGCAGIIPKPFAVFELQQQVEKNSAATRKPKRYIVHSDFSDLNPKTTPVLLR